MQESNPPKIPSQTRKSKRKYVSTANLPVIPEKRYFTIGEASVLCAVKPHVLRYWEQEFSQLKPVKRRGNRRYYQDHDILLIRQIRELLYENGFTIEGARAKLTPVTKNTKQAVEPGKGEDVLKKIIADLEGVLQKLKVEEPA